MQETARPPLLPWARWPLTSAWVRPWNKTGRPSGPCSCCGETGPCTACSATRERTGAWRVPWRWCPSRRTTTGRRPPPFASWAAQQVWPSSRSGTVFSDLDLIWAQVSDQDQDSVDPLCSPKANETPNCALICSRSSLYPLQKNEEIIIWILKALNATLSSFETCNNALKMCAS